MKRFLLTFSLVSACGVVIALAAGIQWGTPACGGVVATTVIIGCFVGAVDYDFRVED